MRLQRSSPIASPEAGGAALAGTMSGTWASRSPIGTPTAAAVIPARQRRSRLLPASSPTRQTRTGVNPVGGDAVSRPEEEV